MVQKNNKPSGWDNVAAWYDGWMGKDGLTRYSARNISPVKARQMIEDGAYQALQNLKSVKPYDPSHPATITIEVDKIEKMADFKGRYGVELDMQKQMVYSRAEDWMTAWNQIWHW
jgi:D-amino peptidase